METTTDTFFGAIDPRLLWALPIGALVEVTYDDLGARRASRYHTIRGVVRRVFEGPSQTTTVALAQVSRTRHDGESTTRDGLNITAHNIMTLTILETFAG